MTDIVETGALLEGKGPKVVQAMLDDASEAVAQAVYEDVKEVLRSVLKHPTGYFESRVVTDISSDGAKVTDGGVIYGPWLEGTSSRNGQTRFKGYQTFRKVTDKWNDGHAEDLIGDAISQRIGDL